jgi:hypothetical protein
MTEINTKQILFNVVQDRRVLVELKTLMSIGGLLYTTETELDKKWDFIKQYIESM